MNHARSNPGNKTPPITHYETVTRTVFTAGVCSLLISWLLVGCGGGGGGGNSDIGSGEPEMQAASPVNAQPLVSSVRDIGPIRQNSAILKRDCGISTRYQGKSIWLFGDTLLESPNAENATFLSNSWSFTYDIDAADGIDGLSDEVDAVGAPAVFFPMTEQETAFNTRYHGESCKEEEQCTAHWHIWPGTILVDEDKGWAYVFYRKVFVERGVLRFIHVGHSIAVWKDYWESPERPVFNYVDSYPTLFFSEQGEYGFGSAAVVVDKEAYIYGCELDSDEITKPCRLARVSLADILDKASWSYYTDEGKWSDNSLDAGQLFYGNDMMSVFFNPYLNRFIAVYSEPLAASAMMRTSPRPEGPWSAPIELFSVDAPANVYGWVYDFLAHPEFSRDNGRTLYISYTRKTDQLHSRLHLVGVTLDLPQ
jgi:hypothetical protein